jgi:hypothetical protein
MTSEEDAQLIQYNVVDYHSGDDENKATLQKHYLQV